MAKKLISTDGRGSATNNKLPAYKPKPKAWAESQVSRDLRLNRERLFYKLFPEQRPEILEYVEFIKKQWELQDAR